MSLGTNGPGSSHLPAAGLPAYQMTETKKIRAYFCFVLLPGFLNLTFDLSKVLDKHLLGA